MANREFTSSKVPVVVIGAATLSADNTPSAIDLQGYDSATLLLQIGIGGITFDGTNKIEFVLTHSDDNSTYTNVSATDLTGASAPTTVTSGIIKSLIVAKAAADVSEYGYIGSKRYLKLLADFSGTHGTGTPICATINKGKPFVTSA